MKKQTASAIFAIALVVCFLLPGHAAWAQFGTPGPRGINLGPVELHPGLAVSETYTDNFFLEPDKDSEWITTISPSLNVHLPLRRHAFDFDYHSDIFRHVNFTNDDVEHHYLSGRFTFDFPGGLLIRVGHEWAALSNPPTFKGEDPFDYKSNVSTLESSYSFTDRYSIGLRYTHSFIRFDDTPDDFDDRDFDDVTLDLNYRILPKTTVFLRGGWAYERYPNREPISTDNHEYRVWLGARTTPAAKIVGFLGGGFSRREWVDDEAGEPIDAFTAEGDLYYDLTPRTRLGLVVARSIETTMDTTTDNVAFGSSYDLTQVTLTATHAFTRRLTAGLGAGVALREFSGEGPPGVSIVNSDRSDTQIFVDANIDYRIWRYIFLGLDYHFADNDSNVDFEDYTENRLTFSVSFQM
jgi:hypothetical protein